MPVSVTMPQLGESVTEGTITRWLKQEGERVDADEPLLEVSTDKVDTEIPSPAAGVLARIVVAEDETAQVGSELAVIAEEGEAAATPAEPAPQQRTAEQAEPQQGEPAPQQRTAEQAQPQEAQPAPQPAQAAPEQSRGESRPAPQRADEGESTVVRMPALGESVTEGTVTRWLKQVGDSVEADEPLLEVSTDKVDTEIPSPAAGRLVEIKVNEDETVAVGADLAVIAAGTAGGPAQGGPAAASAVVESAPAPEVTGGSYTTPAPRAEAPREQAQPAAAPQAAAPQAAAPQAEAPREQAQAGPAPAQPRPEAAAVNGEAGYMTPLVRKLAAEHGVDLASLTGTGVGGRIRKQDVLEAAERARQAERAREAAAQAAAAQASARPAAPAGGQAAALRGRTEKIPRMRALIARRMVESLQISAQLTTVVEVDVTKIARLREAAKADFLATHGVKLSFLPFFALATVEALRVHPNVNASIDMEAGTVTYHDAEHLGIAVDSERGLVVPVIHNAGDLNLAGVAKRIADVAARTRSNKLSPDEISGGTFTLTNTGSRGALFDTPIINQPQVAILGTGAVVKRAVVVDDPNLGELILPRSMVYLALSYDHRQVDGADAARFLATIKDRLEAGNFESELGLG